MSSKPSNTMRDLSRQASADVNRLFSEMNFDLKRATPRASGAASRSWRTEKRLEVLDERDDEATVIRSDSPYMERLNQGWSSQAPKGWIDRSLQNSINRHRGGDS